MLIHYIHRLVAREWVGNPEKKRCVDHVDGSRTNNNWENLRYATHSENGGNAKNRTGGASIYKGVSFSKPMKMWKGTIMIEGRNRHLGFFQYEREAAESYNATAVEHYKESAKLNEFED